MKEKFELLKQRIYADAFLYNSSEFFDFVAFFKLAYYRANGFKLITHNVDPLKVPASAEPIKTALSSISGIHGVEVRTTDWAIELSVFLEHTYYNSIQLNSAYRAEIKELMKIILPKNYRLKLLLYPSINFTEKTIA